MVLEKPLIETRELLRALDPVFGRGREQFELLSADAILSSGVAAPWPTADASDSRLFCSLNRDAVMAFRHGNAEAAQVMRAHAERIERDTIAPWIDALVGEPASADDATEFDRVFYTEASDERSEFAEPVWLAAQEIAEVATASATPTVRPS